MHFFVCYPICKYFFFYQIKDQIAVTPRGGGSLIEDFDFDFDLNAGEEPKHSASPNETASAEPDGETTKTTSSNKAVEIVDLLVSGI